MGERLEAYNTIINDIKEQEKIVENQIKHEVEYSHDDQMLMFKEGLKKEIETYYEKELNDLKVQSATESSQAKLRTKRELLNKRQILVENVFKEVESKLKKFVLSDEYALYIEKCFSKIKCLDENSVFYVNEKEEDFFKEILLKKSLKNDIKQTNLLIGGFKVINSNVNIEFDFTLDTKLKEAKKWFQNNSGYTF